MSPLKKTLMTLASLLVAAGAPLLPRVLAQAAATPATVPAQPLNAPTSRAAGEQAPMRPTRPAFTVGSQGFKPMHETFTPAQIENGGNLFLQNCAFCHGKDAGGGESGPDLTRSKLVENDKKGEAIGQVIRNGRQEKGMPRFSLSDSEILNLVAFIHSQQDKAMSQTGNRKGVDESDLKTGNAAAGKQYFEGEGGCTKCHSATGDLAGVATKFTGLKLEQEMLYPANFKPSVVVKTATGQTLTGPLLYRDEFTIGMRDGFGTYHSWPVGAITYTVNDPAQAHVVAMSKYTDNDIHNVLAYIQTLK